MKGTVRLQIEEDRASGITTSRMWIIPREELREVELDPAHASVVWMLAGSDHMFRVEFYFDDDASPHMAELFYLRLIGHESDDFIIGSNDCKEWRINGHRLNEWLVDDNNPKDLSEYLKEPKS